MRWRQVQPGWDWCVGVNRHADVCRIFPGIWRYRVTAWAGLVPTIITDDWRIGRRRCRRAAERGMAA